MCGFPVACFMLRSVLLTLVASLQAAAHPLLNRVSFSPTHNLAKHAAGYAASQAAGHVAGHGASHANKQTGPPAMDQHCRPVLGEEEGSHLPYPVRAACNSLAGSCVNFLTWQACTRHVTGDSRHVHWGIRQKVLRQHVPVTQHIFPDKSAPEEGRASYPSPVARPRLPGQPPSRANLRSNMQSGKYQVRFGLEAAFGPSFWCFGVCVMVD
jgi:hypothetical protein